MNPFNQPKPWEVVAEPGTMPRRSMIDADEDMDITPMIDITFLLLIFFLVASKMDSSTEVVLPTAKHGTAVTIKESFVLTMQGGRPDFTDVYYGDGKGMKKLDAIDPIVQEELVVGMVQTAAEGEPAKNQVIVRADKDVKHREVARILRAIGQVDGVSAYVAVLEER